MSEDWNVGKLLSVTEDFFSKKGIETARLDAELLLADTLELSRESLLTRREQRLTDIEISSFRERVRQRGSAKPVAYLLRQKEFYSIPFYVDESVLIPRPETEHLVEHALAWITKRAEKKNPPTPFRICDIGAGSGCVSAAIASARTDVAVTSTEIDPRAAALAVRNISDLGLLNRVRIVQCDLFPIAADEPFDVIVSNPPYLSAQEYDILQPSVRKFEPKIALTDGMDGLSYYRRILGKAEQHLSRSGVLLLEISPRIAAEFSNAEFMDRFPLVLKKIHPDLAGLPRVAEFVFRPN